MLLRTFFGRGVAQLELDDLAANGLFTDAVFADGPTSLAQELLGAYIGFRLSGSCKMVTRTTLGLGVGGGGLVDSGGVVG